MSGRCAKCCCFVCPPGRSRREGEHPGVVGSSTGRGPAQAMYAHTAGCEGVTRDERATGMPCEPSHPGLFVPVAVDGCACDIYPQWAGTRPDAEEAAYLGVSVHSVQTVPVLSSFKINALEGYCRFTAVNSITCCY